MDLEGQEERSGIQGKMETARIKAQSRARQAGWRREGLLTWSRRGVAESLAAGRETAGRTDEGANEEERKRPRR